jgi:hypothetical protein
VDLLPKQYQSHWYTDTVVKSRHRYARDYKAWYRRWQYHCENKKVNKSICLILNGYRDKAVWICKYKTIVKCTKMEIIVTNIFILILCFEDKILIQKWQICYSSQCSQIPRIIRHLPTRTANCTKLMMSDNIRPWWHSPQIRTATVRNAGDSLTSQGTIYSAFQLRCPELRRCHWMSRRMQTC